MTRALWLSWHTSRRSSEISRRLGLRLFATQIEGPTIFRHGASALWTAGVLLRHRPSVVYLQYSFLLLVLLALYKTARRGHVVIVCDCHTKALRRTMAGLGSGLFRRIKAWSFRQVDLAVVSNPGLLPECRAFGVAAFVLPDGIPELKGRWRPSSTESYVVYVGSFAADEPLAVLAEAARRLPAALPVYCTGRPRAEVDLSAIEPLRPTGFLPESAFLSLVQGARCIVSLTTEPNCLVCAGYEALALGIPLVVSDTPDLRSYFGSAATYVDHEPGALAEGILRTCADGGGLSARMTEVRARRDDEFREDLDRLRSRVAHLEVRGQPG